MGFSFFLGGGGRWVGQGIFCGFCWKPWEFCWVLIFSPFDHPCPLKSGVSSLGKNPSLWGGTYLYGLHMGVTSPPPPGESPGLIPTKWLIEILQLYSNRNAFQFCSSNYLQTHGTSMGTKIAVGFANALQTNRNLSVHEVLLVSPARCEERLH